MVGMIRHLVKVPGTAVIRALLLFGLGSVVGGALAGMILGIFGHVFRVGLSERMLWFAIAGIGIALALADLGVAGLRTPGFRWQTRYWWWYKLGRSWAWLAWGLHLGFGLITVRITSIYWLVALVVLFIVPWYLAPVTMIGYGLGLVTGVAMMVVLNRFRTLSDGGVARLLEARSNIQVVSAAAILVFVTSVVWHVA